ncbi:MAG TPA: hypothetical protein VMB51_04395 [Solirubrobacteraceae bacterium]|nr:hypothetical protein [Solirubrobacteraceae bacterium]
MSSCSSVFGPLARVWRPVLVVALLAAAAFALGGSFAPVQSAALVLLPALALALAMLVRPYLGARAIARLRARRADRAQRPCSTLLSVGARRMRAHAVRGGRLIAVALAGRAPPPTLLTSR